MLRRCCGGGELKVEDNKMQEISEEMMHVQIHEDRVSKRPTWSGAMERSLEGMYSSQCPRGQPAQCHRGSWFIVLHSLDLCRLLHWVLGLVLVHAMTVAKK